MSNNIEVENTKEENLLKIITEFFEEISPLEFQEYMHDLTVDAALGTQENCRLKNSNRIALMSKTISFINALKVEKEKDSG